MIKNIIKYLYYRYCDPDIVSMTRKQLQLFDMPINVEKLTPEQQEMFYVACQRYLEDDGFKLIMDIVVGDVKTEMLEKSEDKNIIYDRFSINGIYLIKETLQKYSTRLEEKETNYNKHNIT